MECILKMEDFRLSFHGEHGRVEAVKGIDLEVVAGEKVALVGESGCGKTALCRAVMMLHSRHATVESGKILLCGKDVTKMSEKALEQVRGRDAAMVFQDPMTSLNPVLSIGRQIMEPMLLHQKMKKQEARRQAEALLAQVGMTDVAARFRQYPHHFSGGMRQRAAIAIALAANPRLLICDEPTTALDIATQAQIMGLLRAVSEEAHRGVLFVTHDLGLARQMADRIAVMKDGLIVESGAAEAVFTNPQHDYTKALLRHAAAGKCSSYFYDQRRTEALPLSVQNTAPIPLVSVRGLSKQFLLGKQDVRTIFSDLFLTIERGEIVGLIGPSGCGKSTLAKCLAGILEPSFGTISFAPGCRTQLIFQDSAAALNPRMTLAEIIAEPLVIARRKRCMSQGLDGHIHTGKGRFGRGSFHKKVISEKVSEMMQLVGLSQELATRHPYDVSGGQRQRAAIARALITEPDFIVADEPVASLDVSMQAQIVQLLKSLCESRGLTMLFIAHDLPMVARISDRIVEMGKG